MQIDFRERGLIPYEVYYVTEKKTGKHIGDYRIGILGALKPTKPIYREGLDLILESVDDYDFAKM